MNEKSEHTDLFGRPITPGDYIIYSAADGRSATLRVGQVIKLTTVKGYDNNVTAKIYCKSWSNFRSESWNEKKRSGRQKNVTLSFLTRVVVIDPSTISEKVKKDLDGPMCDWLGNPIE